MKKIGELRPRSALMIIIASIFITEAFIMLGFMLTPGIGYPEILYIDPILLVLIVSPVLYYFLYRPMSHNLTICRQSEEALRTLSFLDDLTGLYNRRGFFSFSEQMLKLSQRTKRGLVFVYADLDQMKWINDTFGHVEGDKALVRAGRILKRTFRGSDIVARVGGDEFAVCALEAKKGSGKILKERIDKSFKAQKARKDGRYKLSMSIGIVYYNPEQPSSVKELLKEADISMYKQKQGYTDDGVKEGEVVI